MRALAIVALLAGAAHADARLDDAQRAFEDRDYATVLTKIDAIEQTTGPNVRLQSMRVIALDGLGRPVEAYEAIRVYFGLVAGRSDLAKDFTHQELVALRPKLREAAQEALDKDRAEFDAERKRRVKAVDEQHARIYAKPPDPSVVKQRTAVAAQDLDIAKFLSPILGAADGKRIHEGNADWIVHADDAVFSMRDGLGRYTLRLEHPTTHAITTRSFDRTIAFANVRDIEWDTASCEGCLDPVHVRFTQPIAMTETDASGSRKTMVDVVDFYPGTRPIAVIEATIEMLRFLYPRDTWSKLSSDDKNRIGEVMAHLPRYKEGIELLKAVDAEGKLAHPYKLARALFELHEPDALTYFKRAGEAGNREAIRFAAQIIEEDSPRESRPWWEKLGDEYAMKVAELYMGEDHEKALVWAKRGMADSETPPPFWNELQKRLERLHRLRALPFEQRVAAWTPRLANSYLGKKLSSVPSDFALEKGDTLTNGTMTVRRYTVGALADDRPSQFFVDRDDVIVDEVYLVGDFRVQKLANRAYNGQLFDLIEVFGEDMLEKPGDPHFPNATFEIRLQRGYAKAINVGVYPLENVYRVSIQVQDKRAGIDDLRGTRGILAYDGTFGVVDGNTAIGAGLQLGVSLQPNRFFWIDLVATPRISLVNTDGASSALFDVNAGPRLRFGKVNRPLVGFSGGPSIQTQLKGSLAEPDTLGWFGRFDVSIAGHIGTIAVTHHDPITSVMFGLSLPLGDW